MKNVVKVDFSHCVSLTPTRKKINWVINNICCCCSQEDVMKPRWARFQAATQCDIWTSVASIRRYDKIPFVSCSPLKCFGQQTNSTPENNEIPHGNSIAKLRICILRSWHADAPVWFHRTNGQQRDALWMWSNKQPSGTSKASDWKGPSGKIEKIDKVSWIAFTMELIKNSVINYS